MEIYISTDVETDGPIPGPNSMLSLGSAAYLEDKTLVSTIEINFETLPDATEHPDTMEFWGRYKKAYDYTRVDTKSPEVGMKEYVDWVSKLEGKPVFVAYPAGFDFLFVYWYLIKFAGHSPFSHSALDMKTFAMSLMGKGYRESTKRNMPRHWFDKHPHTHKALDDAIEQGALFCNMLADWKKKD